MPSNRLRLCAVDPAMPHLRKIRAVKSIADFFFDRLPKFIIGFLIFVAIAINVANVAARHIFHAPFIWAEEILVYIMVWVIFVGIILVSRREGHLKMDLIAASFPKRMTRYIKILTEFITTAVCLVVLWASYQVLSTLWDYGQRSIAAEIPMVIPHFAIPLGIGFVAFQHFIAFFRSIGRLKSK